MKCTYSTVRKSRRQLNFSQDSLFFLVLLCVLTAICACCCISRHLCLLLHFAQIWKKSQKVLNPTVGERYSSKERSTRHCAIASGTRSYSVSIRPCVVLYGSTTYAGYNRKNSLGKSGIYCSTVVSFTITISAVGLWCLHVRRFSCVTGGNILLSWANVQIRNALESLDSIRPGGCTCKEFAFLREGSPLTFPPMQKLPIVSQKIDETSAPMTKQHQWCRRH